MRGPHPGSQTFAADVTQGNDYAAVRLLYGEKVTGQVANGENFAGNIDVAVPDQTRSAQAPVHLRSFEECGVQIGVILLKCRELQLQFPIVCPITRALAWRRRGLDRTPCLKPAIECGLTHKTVD